METRIYRLKVGGTVTFTDKDKEIEELFLIGITSPQRTERAIQSLREEAIDLQVEMVLIIP